MFKKRRANRDDGLITRSTLPTTQIRDHSPTPTPTPTPTPIPIPMEQSKATTTNQVPSYAFFSLDLSW